MFNIKVCQWLDSNCGPLVSEESSLPTESQPLPCRKNCYPSQMKRATELSTWTKILLGSGGGSVGRLVTSNSRGPQFESSHRQKIILNIHCQLYWKDENKEKEAGNDPFFKKNIVMKRLKFSWRKYLVMFIMMENEWF